MAQPEEHTMIADEVTVADGTTEGGHTKKKKKIRNPQSVAIKAAIGALMVVLALHVCFTYVYFGAVWGVEKGYPNIHVAIVNADQAVLGVSIGSLFTTAITNVGSPYKPGSPLMHWEVVSGNNVSFAQLKRDVFDTKYWFAIYIPSNFTGNLLGALLGQSTPLATNLSLIYDEGRQYTTIATGRTMLKSVITQISNSMGTAILGGKFGFAINTSVADLSAVINPIRVSDVNLHPVGSLGPSFSTYMGFIVLWLSCLLTVNVIKKTTAPLAQPGLPFWTAKRLALLKCGLGAVTAFFLALLLTGITRGFGLDFHRGFGAHFALCWITGTAFMALISSIIILLGDAGVMLTTLILYIQIGSSSSIYSAELMPQFYEAVGPVFPMYHAVHAARTISFGSADELGLNIGILFVWIVVCGISSFFTLRYQLRKKFKKVIKDNPALDVAVKAVGKGNMS